MITGILLAAGESSRMGKENKLLLPIDGEPMFKKALSAMEDSEIGELIVVLGHDYKDMMPYFNSCSIKLAINGNHLEGQTTSIVSGLKLINPSSKGILICLADMPLLTKDHIDSLIKAFKEIKEEKVIMKPVNAGKPGNPVIFGRAFYEELLSCPDPEGCRSVIANNKEYFHPFESQDIAFFTDVDTPEEYANLI